MGRLSKVKPRAVEDMFSTIIGDVQCMYINSSEIVPFWKLVVNNTIKLINNQISFFTPYFNLPKMINNPNKVVDFYF